MSGIFTNVNALRATNALVNNGRTLSLAMQQLSTGKRINSAADDSAGLAMSESMTAQIRGLDMAVRNANDAISMLQTADGALVAQTDMLQRMRELAVQSASDTVSSTERTYLSTEYTALITQLDSVGNNTEWNGMAILSGTGQQISSTSGEYTFQVGANGTAAEAVTVTINNMTTSSGSGQYASLESSLTVSNSSAAITALDNAIDAVAAQRASIGAGMNRLTYAADNLTNISQNVMESRSRILDTDYAKASSMLARSQIIQQAATAMLAQANQQPQMVLALLK
jgi:flagellin